MLAVLSIKAGTTGGTIFFSTFGLRDVYSNEVNNSNGGAVLFNSSYGFYWTANPSGSLTYAYHLFFAFDAVYPQTEYYRASGYTVNPVLE